MWFSRVQGEDNRRGKRDPTCQLTPRGRRMTGSAGSAVDVLVIAIAFFNRRRVREEVRGDFAPAEGRRMTGSAAKRSGRCMVME